MTERSYQYGPLPSVQNNDAPNNDSYNNGRDQSSHDGGQDFQSFQRGLEAMYTNTGPGGGNYGRWNIYMVGCIFIAFLVLLSGTQRHQIVVVDTPHNNIDKSSNIGQVVPAISPQPFERSTLVPTSQGRSKYAPKSLPVVPLPSPPTNNFVGDNNSDPKPKTTEKQIHILMAFPMSGVSYTFHLFSSLTSQLTLGTNDARSKQEIPLFKDSYPNGPFLYPSTYNNFDPENTFLVMTHCGETCLDFAAECRRNVETKTIWSFDTECRLTTKPLERAYGLSLSSYDRSLVDYNHAIHLIRDPLANLVSLFHLDLIVRNDAAYEIRYPNTKEGYSDWCGDQTKIPDNWHALGDYLVQEHLEKIPCFFQLFQYVQWHMLTYQLHEGKAHIIRFEDYDGDKHVDAAKPALQFLNLETNDGNNAPPFRGAHMYTEYYTDDQKKAMWELIKIISPPGIYQKLFVVYESKI